MEFDFSRCRLSPFAHQREDTQALCSNPFFFITSEMRTGKTKIVIDAAQFLFEAGIIDKVLVIAPAPVRDVWFDKDMGELHKHLWLDIPCQISEFHSTLRTWEHGPNTSERLKWVITNYEFIRSKNRLKQLLPFCTIRTLLVLDESSFIKSHRAEQTKACLQLRRACGRVVLLNGTPISHSPMDLFSQGNLLHPLILDCKFITHYRARYAIMGGFKVNGKPVQITGWTNLADLQRRFAPITVRRLQKDCLDLPPKLDPVTLTTQLAPTTWKIYKEMRDECVIYFEKAGTASVAAQAVVKTLRLAQITSGFLGGVQGEDDHSTPEVEIGREKLDVLLWFLGQRFEQDECLKVIVWCRFRSELFRLLKEVRSTYPQFIIGALHGDQKKQERLEALQLLHPDTTPLKFPVLVGGTYGTGSFGINLTASHTSINCSSDFSLGKFLQSADRVYGPGQTAPIAYFDIVATGPQGQRTIDHTIIKARRNREDVATWTSTAWVKALKEDA